VHLAAQSLPPSVARGLLEPWQLLGVSVHSTEDAVAAARAGADYLTFGHVYPTWAHRDEPARGVRMLAEVVAAAEVPVLAIGGITAERVAEVLAAGCAGVAVISAVLSADDPAAAARALRAALDRTRHEPRRTFPERRD
jgi:thiamine-phosphate pyrophosphorylase